MNEIVKLGKYNFTEARQQRRQQLKESIRTRSLSREISLTNDGLENLNSKLSEELHKNEVMRADSAERLKKIHSD